MRIRKLFCTVLSICLILSMTPVAWADTGTIEEEPVVTEQPVDLESTEDTLEVAEPDVIDPVAEEPEEIIIPKEDPDVEEPVIEETKEEPSVPAIAPGNEAPPATVAETATGDLVLADSNGDLSIDVAEVVYSGEEKTPVTKILLYDPGYYLPEYADYSYDEYIELVEGADYTVAYENNIEAGEATVIITGIGKYSGTVSRPFDIKPRSVSNASIGTVTNKTYKASAWKPTPSVTVDGVKLVKGTDYTLSYSANIKAGTAKVIIKGKGNYSGSKTKTFTILRKDLSKAKVTVKSGSVYTGKAKKPTVTVKLYVGGKTRTLKKGTDYTVKYSNNIKAGKAKVTITGKGNYKGKATKTFIIKKRNLSKAKVTGVTYQKYTGKAKKPVPTVKLKIGSTTKTLKRGTDYTITYRNNVRIGTATVIIKGKGNYTGTIKKTFSIYSSKTYYEKRYSGKWKCIAVYDSTIDEIYMGSDLFLTSTFDIRTNHRAYMYINGEYQGAFTWRISGSYLSLDDGYETTMGMLKKGELYVAIGDYVLIYKK